MNHQKFIKQDIDTAVKSHDEFMEMVKVEVTIKDEFNGRASFECSTKVTKNLNIDIKQTRHVGKVFQCIHCDKKNSRKNDLARHVRIHNGEDPYKCDVCLKQFNRKGNLTKHQVVHTGRKSYKCDVCFKYFTEKGSLIKHQVIHTGNKPYICDIV